MSDRLVALLEQAASHADFPETPPLAERVRARVEAGPLPVAEIRLPRTRPTLARPVLVALTVAALTLGVSVSLSATARRAVADLLGVVGIEISFDEPPGVTPRPASEIDLGTRVSRTEASERARFRVTTPAVLPGTPAFYFDGSIGDRGMVSVVYPRDAASLAEAELLVSEFIASLDEEYVKKLSTLGSNLRYVSLRGVDGYWVGGEPHIFFYEDSSGSIRQESVRLAGKVLLWEEDGVTYRVEGAASLAEARRIAESLR